MSILRIPNDNKQVIQSNIGDYQGNVWSTFNIDLDSNSGTIKVAPRLKRVLGADEIGSNFIQGLTVHDGFYYAISDGNGLRCSVNNDPTVTANWSESSALNTLTFTLDSDVVSFAGLLLVSASQDIGRYNGSSSAADDWWTSDVSGTALTEDKPHIMEILRTGNDTLFVTDGNIVRYYNAEAGHIAITLDTFMTTCSLTPSLDRMWAGTYTEVEENAFIYELRVGDDTAIQAYEIAGRAALTMFTYKNTPFVITDRGLVQAFDGAGFVTVAQFPWANESKVMTGVRPGLVQDTSVSRAIHPKGAKVSGKYCYVFVNTEDEYESGTNLNDRSPSGVWVLDLETYSLTHKYSLTVDSTDYGWSKVTRSGPLLITNTPETRIMVGAEVNTDEEGLWMEGTETSQGFFTTVRHESQSVADAFEKAVLKHDTLADGQDVVLKYKTTEEPFYPLKIDDITWLNSTQFVTSADLTDIQPDRDGAYGQEIFILAGHQAGKMCHITDITTATQSTVTVDTALGTLNETSDIQIENYYKVTKNDSEEVHAESSEVGANEVGAFRQYKVVLTGDVTLRELISKSNNKGEL